MADLGKLIGTIELRDKNFAKQLTAMDRKLDGFGRKVAGTNRRAERSFAALGNAAGSLRAGLASLGAFAAIQLGRGFQRMVREAIGAGDAIAKTADRVGVGVEALQELRFAADQAAGLGFQALDTALQRVSRRIGEAANGGGEAAGAFKELGVQLRDSQGHIRSTEDILRDVADAMMNVRDSQDQLRISQKLFDQEGAGLVNLLRQGGGALDRYAAQARDLGLVIDESLVREAEDAQSRLGALDHVISAQLTQSLIELAPVIEFSTGLMLNLAKATGDWVAAFQDVPDRALRQLEERAAQIQRILANPAGVIGPAGIQDLRKELAELDAEIERRRATRARDSGSPLDVGTGSGLAPGLPRKKSFAGAAAALRKAAAEADRFFALEERARRAVANLEIDALNAEGRAREALLLSVQLQKQELEIFREALSPEEFAAALANVDRMTRATLAGLTENIERTWAQSFESMGGTLGEELRGAFDGVDSDWQSLLNRMVAAAAQAGLELAATRALSSSALDNSSGGNPLGGFVASVLKGFAGLEGGGITTRQGLVNIHPQEAVIPLEQLPSMVGNLGGDLRVEVMNPPGVPLEAASVGMRRGPSGERVLELALEKATLRNLAGRGRVARAIQPNPPIGGLR